MVEPKKKITIDWSDVAQTPSDSVELGDFDLHVKKRAPKGIYALALSGSAGEISPVAATTEQAADDFKVRRRPSLDEVAEAMAMLLTQHYEQRGVNFVIGQKTRLTQAIRSVLNEEIVHGSGFRADKDGKWRDLKRSGIEICERSVTDKTMNGNIDAGDFLAKTNWIIQAVLKEIKSGKDKPR